MFANRALTPHDLVVPWLAAGLFTLAGLAISFAVRPDPKELSQAHTETVAAPAPVRELLTRPGVPTAMLGAVASFAVMVGVMNLAGYVAVGHGHHHGDIFTIISVHIVGMYGLVLVVGDVVERIGRRRAIVIGLVVMAFSNLVGVWSTSLLGMSLSLFGLGLGWNFSYVAATTELVNLATPAERGRLVGLSDLLSGGTGAALALTGGVLYTGAGATSLALAATALAAAPALWIAATPVLGALRPRTA
jgi:MFS family permease